MSFQLVQLSECPDSLLISPIPLTCTDCFNPSRACFLLFCSDLSIPEINEILEENRNEAQEHMKVLIALQVNIDSVVGTPKLTL